MIINRPLKIVLAIVLLVFLLYSFLLSNFNPMYNNLEFKSLSNSIKSSNDKKLDSIVYIYNKIHKSVKENRCPCKNAVAFIHSRRHGFSISKSIYSMKIHKEYSEDDCLKFLFLNEDFVNGNIGIKAASQFYFSKSFDKLNEDEKITFIVMLKNPSLYNPVRRKEKVKNKVQLYKQIFHKNVR